MSAIRIITTEIRRQSVQFIPTAYVWVAPGTAIIHGPGGQIPPPLRKEKQRQVETKITSQKYRRGAGGGGRGEFTLKSCKFKISKVPLSTLIFGGQQAKVANRYDGQNRSGLDR